MLNLLNLKRITQTFPHIDFILAYVRKKVRKIKYELKYE